MPGGETSNIYSISHGAPFLRTFASGLLEGRILPSHMGAEPKDALSTITIYLPTRRAARALRAEFTNLLKGEPCLLPVIRTLGDSDEEEFLVPQENLQNSILQKKITDPLWRQIQLARLVKKWVEMIGEEARQLYRDENIIIPSSSAEALWLAREVGSLVDQLITEEISWTQLENIVPQEHAQWWGLTLDFLKIATQSWPLQLAEINAVDVAQYRNNVLDARCVALENVKGPVIVAGSTGSIPATARFLKAVALRDNGAVILPGVDFGLGSDIWSAIGGGMKILMVNAGVVDLFDDHPQYGLVKILNFIGYVRGDVCELGECSLSKKMRAKLNSIAMLPSKFTDQWLEKISGFNDAEIYQATREIAIINAANERQEAMAIALVLREALEDPQVNAALITPDRNLARRVKAELKRFNLEIDDSGGTTLDGTSEAVFVRLVISVALDLDEGVALAALVKHPLLFGEEYQKSNISRLFELCLTREVAVVARPGIYAEQLNKCREAALSQSHVNVHVGRMSEEDWLELIAFGERLDVGFTALIALLANSEARDISEIFLALMEVMNALSRADAGSSTLFDSNAGDQLLQLFATITNPKQSEYMCDTRDLLAVFDALISGQTVRGQRQTHPQLSILGPLEARLQPIDVAVLGGLNEGSWPQIYDSGPFLNRPMKSAIGLSTPERRTGLAAHDFEQFMGYRKVFITRSQRVDNAPSVTSRWVQRFMAVAGENASNKMAARGDAYLRWANLLDQPNKVEPRVVRPCPAPPIHTRPTRFSITDIETWIRDPYAIYAKRILNLAVLPKIGLKPEPMLRGILLHDALAEYVSLGHDPEALDAEDVLLKFIVAQAERQVIPRHLLAVWLPRFKEIAASFIADEISQTPLVSRKYCEINCKLILNDGKFELRGRADRVDLLNTSEVRIVDYKTGSTPSLAEARKLFSPQLPLEGAIALAGGFDSVPAAIPASLVYIRLKGRNEYNSEKLEKKDVSANDLSRRAHARLEKHIEKYNDANTGYLSRYAVARETVMNGDYDHLARVKEWSLGSEGEEGDVDG